MLGEHVAARYPEVRRALLHVGRHVGRRHDDEAHVPAVRGEDQLARGFRIAARDDARGLQ